MSKTYIKLSLNEYTIDPRVQRGSVEQTHVNDIVQKWDPLALGTITVSLRGNGDRVVIDGAHRSEAARQIGYTRKMDCCQYTGLDLPTEAAMFLSLNNTKRLNVLDSFRVRQVQGDKIALGMKEVLDKYGWRAAGDGNSFNLAAITSFEKVYLGSGVRQVEHGPELASMVLHVITEAWEGDVTSPHAIILGSLGKFLGYYGAEVDIDKTIKVLGCRKPRTLLADISGMAEVAHVAKVQAGAAVLVGLHNTGRRKNVLDPWTRH